MALFGGPSTPVSRLEELKRLLQKDPTSRQFLALAEEYRRHGKYRDAVITLERGLQMHSTSVAAHVALGRTYQQLDRLEDAIRAFTNALRLDRENLVAIRQLAEVYLARGDKIEAIKKLKLYRGLQAGDRDVNDIIQKLEEEMSAAVAEHPRSHLSPRRSRRFASSRSPRRLRSRSPRAKRSRTYRRRRRPPRSRSRWISTGRRRRRFLPGRPSRRLRSTSPTRVPKCRRKASSSSRRPSETSTALKATWPMLARRIARSRRPLPTRRAPARCGKRPRRFPRPSGRTIRACGVWRGASRSAPKRPWITCTGFSRTSSRGRRESAPRRSPTSRGFRS